MSRSTRQRAKTKFGVDDEIEGMLGKEEESDNEIQPKAKCM